MRVGTKSQIFNLYKGIADLLKVSGDNLALHTINTLFKSKYEGRADVSVSWKAQAGWLFNKALKLPLKITAHL